VPVALSPLGLSGNYSGDQTVTLTGANAAAQAGNVVGSGESSQSALGRLGPLGLHQALYSITAKVGFETVTLTGAQVAAQAEELEGCSVTIRLTGATVFANGTQKDQSYVDSGVRIENDNAEDGFGNYEIDQRTGFKQLPMWHPDSQLVRDGYGELVRRKSQDMRHPQDYVQSGRNVPQEGPQNPESDDSFLSATISPEDL
jgi:hypothetical protein